MPILEAIAVAHDVMSLLFPVVERIDIVGSIRRGKDEVGDVELLYVPKLVPKRNMFDEIEGHQNLAYELLAELRQRGTFVDRLDKNDRPAFGPRFQRLLFSGVPLDLFACLAPAQYGVHQLIRTGSAEFSQKMVTPQAQGGALPMGMRVQDAQLIDRGEALVTPNEETFFAQVGMPFVDPAHREAWPTRAIPHD
jgi:DNA polymerase/3'-5' exonuclease PolX